MHNTDFVLYKSFKQIYMQTILAVKSYRLNKLYTSLAI